MRRRDATRRDATVSSETGEGEGRKTSERVCVCAYSLFSRQSLAKEGEGIDGGGVDGRPDAALDANPGQAEA